MEDTSMDAQTMLIVVVIFIISAILLYLMSVYGFREKSYEEVIMEQQRMMAEEETSKKDKKEKKKKPAKKVVKRVTTTTTTTVQAEQEKKDEEVKKMVQLEIDAEIIEAQPAMPEKENKKSHSRPENIPKKNREKEKEKAKSILSNKDEKSLVKETLVVRETIHTGPTPKDELELRHERHAVQAVPETAAPVPEPSNKKKRDKRAAKEEAKKHEEEQAAKEAIIQEQIIVMEETAPVKSEPPKKSKKERTPPAKAAPTEVVNATNNDSDDWIKKSKQGDPTALLKRQLEDKERALADEQQSCLGAKMKLKEIHQELTNERNRYLMLEAQSKQSVQKQGEEIKALHNRMQQTHEQHRTEVNAIKYQMEQIGAQRGNEGAVHRIQRLEQENKQLQDAVGVAQAAARNSMENPGMQQQVKILQDELQKNVSKLTMSESRLKKSEVAHKDNEILKKRLNEMAEAMKLMENKNKTMSYELDAATGTLAKRDNELGALRNQIKDLEKKAGSAHNGNIIRNLENKLSDTENQRAMLEDQFRKIQQNLLELEAKSGDEIRMLRNENGALKEELKNNRQRTSGEGQEAAVVREEPCGQVQSQKMTYDTNNIIKEKEAALASLQLELKNVQVERDTMANQMQVELQKLQSERSQLQSSGKNTETAVGKLEAQLNRLQSEKDSAVNQLHKFQQENKTLSVQLQVASDDQGTAVKKLNEEIRKLQTQHSSVISRLEVDLQNVKKEKEELSGKLQAAPKGQDAAMTLLNDDVKKLTADLEKQRQKNNELREKNSRAIDTMVKSDKGQSSQASKGDVSSDKQQRATRELLQRLFPHVSVKSSLGHNEWMSAFEREASKYLLSESASNSSTSDGGSQIEEFRQNQGKLQAQVQHYKSVLAETEGILNRLQNSVENEETKWQQRVKTAEDDASKAKEEIKRLKSEVQKGPEGKAALAKTNGEGTSV